MDKKIKRILSELNNNTYLFKIAVYLFDTIWNPKVIQAINVAAKFKNPFDLMEE